MLFINLAAAAAVLMTPALCATQDTCSASQSAFELTVADVTSRLAKRTCGEEGSLTVNLHDGVLTDSLGRTGCIVANYQFQFDGPPQAGTIYQSGWSICDGELALNGNETFYKCPSGHPDGSIFYNIYDRKWAPHCEPHYLIVLPCDGYPSGPPSIGQIGDGQLQHYPPGHPTPVYQIGDGQLQQSPGHSTPVYPSSTVYPTPVYQIGDGQLQQSPGHSTPVYPSSTVYPISPVYPSHPTPVGQIGDGQLQQYPGHPTPVYQIGDGQLQQYPPGHPTPVYQIGDGQLQQYPGHSVTVYPSHPTPVYQIGDGQLQQYPSHSVTVYPTVTYPTVTYKTVTYPTTTYPTITYPTITVYPSHPTPVSQIGDGQLQHYPRPSCRLAGCH